MQFVNVSFLCVPVHEDTTRKLISILKFLKTPFEFLFHNTRLRKLQQILPQSLHHS